jgi:hypothetical protein
MMASSLTVKFRNDLRAELPDLVQNLNEAAMWKRYIRPGNPDAGELAELVKHLLRAGTASEEPCFSGSNNVNIMKSSAVGCETPI